MCSVFTRFSTQVVNTQKNSDSNNSQKGLLTKKGFYNLLNNLYDNHTLTNTNEEQLKNTKNPTQTLFYFSSHPKGKKKICIWLGEKNSNDCDPLFKTAKQSWFLEQQLQTFPTWVCAWNESVHPRALSRGSVSISKHQNYSFPGCSRLFCFLWVKHESFFPGLLFMLFFVLKQSHCCLLLCLERREGYLYTPDLLCQWGTREVCSFLSFAWAKPKIALFPLHFCLTGKKLLTVPQIVSWKLDSFYFNWKDPPNLALLHSKLIVILRSHLFFFSKVKPHGLSHCQQVVIRNL